MSWNTYTGDKSFTADEGLPDLVRAIRNRCDALLYLSRLGSDVHYVFPTLIEDMYEDCQELIDTYCIEE